MSTPGPEEGGGLTAGAHPVGEDTPFGPHIRQYLGRKVRVTLDEGPPPSQRPTVTGTLIHATDDGEVTVRDTDGVNHYAWPGLHIQVLP